jgi:hypothetical protein
VRTWQIKSAKTKTVTQSINILNAFKLNLGDLFIFYRSDPIDNEK